MIGYLLTLLSAPLWLPLLAVVAVISRLMQGAPVFFVQERVGKGGKPFRLIKFRTMREGAGSDFERMTSWGRFLRSTSLDELPQLLQVLSGTMALVGPRPLPIRYLPRYSAEQARRHDVRPGLTGWAQINGRNAISWEQKFAYDVWYVEHRSEWLDLKIIGQTLAAILLRRGIDSGAGETMPEFAG